ncbi:MAG: hypothetical protein CMQ51_06970 [Gammaproteobacteria bacterium]|nr:hypothetical protein [Gammaproteobacteria bacterium]|tara:strand:+ start:765 stop:980 length:216 start_codon:yes stop_codon:yes gene_type:complete
MKVGDLVTWAFTSPDVDDEAFTEYGLVIDVQGVPDAQYTSQRPRVLIKFMDGDESWIYKNHLEVVNDNESR